MAHDDDNKWLLCPSCKCGITEVDIEEVGACTNCSFNLGDSRPPPLTTKERDRNG